MGPTTTIFGVKDRESRQCVLMGRRLVDESATHQEDSVGGDIASRDKNNTRVVGWSSHHNGLENVF